MEEDKFANAPKPGRLVCVHTGMDCGPASYEQAEAFRKSGGRPIHTTYAGCPVLYVVKEKKSE